MYEHQHGYKGAGSGNSLGDDMDANLLELPLGRSQQVAAAAQSENPALAILSQAHKDALTNHLRARLENGQRARSKWVHRYRKIDRAISTWQRLNPEDSQRKLKESAEGLPQAIPFNLPIMAAHLTDMTSYFAEALAPISNPFATSSGDQHLLTLTRRLNKDALARDYYGELVLTVRSLLKYNLGGLWVAWDKGAGKGVGTRGVLEEGNTWRGLDLYNTYWDPTISDPTQVSHSAEWAATTRLTNRIEIARRSVAGEWTGTDKLVGGESTDRKPALKLWQNPSAAVPGTTGEDAVSRPGDSVRTLGEDVAWGEYGLGSNAGEPTNRSFELTTMYCWIVPKQFGLIPRGVAKQMRDSGLDPNVFLQLWRFEIIDGSEIVSAHPAVDPQRVLSGEDSEHIPFFLSYFTRDQVGEVQRSMMELMQGFQRFASSMYAVYVSGLRANVWGLKVFDPSMIDGERLRSGETAGVIPTMKAGVDVRAALAQVGTNSGVQEALQAVDTGLGLKNQLFPSQALPNQIAGMDRAVTSQVATVVQGAQRGLRMLLRLLDSSLMLPARMEAVRNLARHEGLAEAVEIKDEDVAKTLGSGIESMESERIAEHFWRLMTAIIQNQESMQLFNVPELMAYLGRLMNLGVDMASFVRQQPESSTQPPAPPSPGGSVPTTA